MKRILLIALLFLPAISRAQTYSLPNNDAACPNDCRVIPWQSGSDIWNSGSLPVYSQVTCSPLNENGVTDDTTNINNCITAANAGTGGYATCHAAGGCAVYLPAGTIYVNGVVRLKSNVVVRGAGPTTLIKLGASGQFDTQNYSWSNSANLNPTTNYATLPSTFTLSGTPHKGDTTVTCATGCGSVTGGANGTFIKVFGNDDPSLISDNMYSGSSYYKCDQCSDNTGYYLQQQIVQVTNVAGSVFTLSKPLYYNLYTTAVTTKDSGHNNITEPAGAKFNIIGFPTQKAGYEYFHVTGGYANVQYTPLIQLQGCLYCWEKGVEADTTGTGGEASMTRLMFTYGAEIRDSYFHDERDGSGGTGYGIYAEWVNGDAKIENNIVRHSRHPIIFQGGGSGFAILFNYVDDSYTDDLTYNGSARTDHGAHPYMNLWEGNVISHITADDCWGSSSHNVFFRNWLWGDFTGNWTVPYPGTNATTPSGSNPGSGFDAIDLYTGSTYYSFVGNVLGKSGLHATWSGATLRTNNAYGTRANPVVYSYGGTPGIGTGTCDDITDSTIPSANTTSLNHGNFDYKTNGVAYWEGGANHTLATSIYYVSKPSFLSAYAWPLEGPESNPTVHTNPAEDCWLAGGSFNAATCYAAGPPPVSPAHITGIVVITGTGGLK